jgi:hypothetical protein
MKCHPSQSCPGFQPLALQATEDAMAAVVHGWQGAGTVTGNGLTVDGCEIHQLIRGFIVFYSKFQ